MAGGEIDEERHMSLGGARFRPSTVRRLANSTCPVGLISYCTCGTRDLTSKSRSFCVTTTFGCSSIDCGTKDARDIRQAKAKCMEIFFYAEVFIYNRVLDVAILMFNSAKVLHSIGQSNANRTT